MIRRVFGEDLIRAPLTINPNPLVKVTLVFEDGCALDWKLSRPMPQEDVFGEIGKLAARCDLGIDFDFPEQKEG